MDGVVEGGGVVNLYQFLAAALLAWAIGDTINCSRNSGRRR